MGPKETLHAGGVNIVLVIRVPVVVAVHGGPPERPALHGSETEQGEEKLGDPRGVVGAVAEVAVVDGCDREHAGEIQHCGGDDRCPTPTGPNNSEAAEMKDDKRNRSAELKFLRHLAHFFSPLGEVVRVDCSNNLCQNFFEHHFLFFSNADQAEDAVQIIIPVVFDLDRTPLVAVVEGHAG